MRSPTSSPEETDGEIHFSREFLSKSGDVSLKVSYLNLPGAIAFATVAFSGGSLLWSQSSHPLTVEQIWGQPSPTGVPPQGIQWAPDAGRVTYLSPEADLMQLLPTNGATTTLISHTKLSALGSAASNEKDKDHRDSAMTCPAISGGRTRSTSSSIAEGSFFFIAWTAERPLTSLRRDRRAATTRSLLRMGSLSRMFAGTICMCIASRTRLRSCS